MGNRRDRAERRKNEDRRSWSIPRLKFVLMGGRRKFARLDDDEKEFVCADQYCHNFFKESALMSPNAEKVSADCGSNKEEIKTARIERRKYARVPISVAVSVVSVDSDSMPIDQNKGVIRNVSQTGAKIEAWNTVSSDRLKLAFVDFNDTAEITGKVVFSKKDTSGTYSIGVQLQGSKPDISRFVSRAVRFYHYTKNIRRVDYHSPNSFDL